MTANSLRRVLTAKATTFVGLAMLVAVVLLVIASMASVGQAGAQAPPKAQAKSSFGAKAVITNTGALPHTGTYESKGGTLIVSAAGSGYSATPNQKIGMTVFVDGRRVGTAQVFTNEPQSHKAFVPAFLVVNNVPRGPVTIEVDDTGFTQTKTDQNDFFRVTVEEQPRG
jgi:hypothetical protein